MHESDTLTYLAENFDSAAALLRELPRADRLRLMDMFIAYAQAAAGDEWDSLISQYVTLQ
jgi:hypothetical protein